MSGKSNIGWTDEVWNPWTGCSHVSPGCLNCYAETLSLRRGWSKKPWTKQNEAENVVEHRDRLEDPLRWKRPRLVFVNSMSDLFHERIPFPNIADVFGVMQRATQHTFQVLTKRPERMLEFTQWMESEDAEVGGNLRDEGDWPCPNIWLGVSVEDQRRADERIPLLLQTPAAVRWISAEPLLGPLDLTGDPDPVRRWLKGGWREARGVLTERWRPGLDWVVVGGESGPDYRGMDVDWATDIAAQCSQYNVPLFMKQDSGAKPGKQGRLPDSLWSRKEYPA